MRHGHTHNAKPVYLFLQGPHGPFFGMLGRRLTNAGVSVLRVGFNAGDRVFWGSGKNYIPYRETIDGWETFFDALIQEKGVTDLVLYGDTKPFHMVAIARAKAAGLRIHVFEEGYLRPYWVTYERDGSNGHSRLMQKSVEEMQRALHEAGSDEPPPPSHWGDMRQHVFYGALYHWFVMFASQGYSRFVPHRELPVSKELLLYTKRFFAMPFHALDRLQATLRIKFGGYPYHVVLLQLEHDPSFRKHSPFNSMTEFVAMVLENFAKGALPHHQLVIKAHPLEDGRSSLRKLIRKRSTELGIQGRVHFVRGGKLATLLDSARSAVTVSSTAAQQVLWRGIPLRAFGASVFNKPEFNSEQTLSEFFTNPDRPNARAYKDYRRYLLETSQLTGGFYSSKGRKQLLRVAVDLMLSPSDPYDLFEFSSPPTSHQLRLVGD